MRHGKPGSHSGQRNSAERKFTNRQLNFLADRAAAAAWGKTLLEFYAERAREVAPLLVRRAMTRAQAAVFIPAGDLQTLGPGQHSHRHIG